MKSRQIDKLCIDWLKENYGEELASKYKCHSLLIDVFNSLELNEALESLTQVLRIAFGPDRSFGTTDYHEARRRIGLHEDVDMIPEAFIKAFSETVTEAKGVVPRLKDY